MIYKNDPERAFQWLKANGAIHHWKPRPEELEAVNKIAEACMSVYQPQQGDKTCVGWFPYTEVYNQDGSPAPDHYRHSDGMCVCLGKNNECAIGIRMAVLKQNFYYTVAGVGLHEVAHMRYNDHNDDFVSYLLTLQYEYSKKRSVEK